MDPAMTSESRRDMVAAAVASYDEEIRALTEGRDAACQDLPAALELLAGISGKIVVSGIGKSGHIAAKIAATLASVGRPAVFVHATEALHGDSGVVQPGDGAIVISNSGTTTEVCSFALMLRDWSIPTVAMTQNPDSTLGRLADHVLRVAVPREADPLGLAPTSSTTLTLALGDALAAGLMTESGFRPEDFAERHPGGALGQRLSDENNDEKRSE